MTGLASQLQSTQALGSHSDRLAPLIGELKTRFSDNLAGILFYGSCLASDDIGEGLVDLLVLVDDYQRAHTGPVGSCLNAMLPPNVYFLEIENLKCKYALITLAQFQQKMHSRIDHYFWARFAQPFSVVYARREDIKTKLVGHQIQALTTFYSNLVALQGPPEDPLDFWSDGLRQTYGCDLRPESPAHSRTVIARAPEFWRNVTKALMLECPQSQISTSARRMDWQVRRVVGKLLNLARLIKAAGTFTNGIDYLAWKVERHSGVKVEPAEWMHRHPRLGGLKLAFGLWRQGGFR